VGVNLQAHMDIKIIIKIDTLIRMAQTGTPKELAAKVGMSERTVFGYLAYMKNQLNAPIEYDTANSSYCYFRECAFCFWG
jgi:hypothetical protein